MRRPAYIRLSFIIALPTLLFLPAIVRNQIPYFMDTITQFYPLKYLAAQQLHNGEFPFWNPSTYCGVPLFANPQWGIAYPGNFLFFLIPNGSMYTLCQLLHIILFGLGIYVWVRELRRDGIVSFSAALFGMFSGYIWAHLAFGAFLYVIAWIPWYFMLLERFARDRRIKYVIFGAIVIALQILAGAPQIVVYSIVAYFLLAFFRSVFPIEDNPVNRQIDCEPLSRFGPLIFFVSALCAGVCLTAFQWLPQIQLFAQSERMMGLELREVAVGSLSKWQILAAFFGGTGIPEDAETTVYFGVPILFFFSIALRRFFNRKLLPYVIILVGSVLYSLRITVETFFDLLPIYSHFHDPKRALALAAVTIPLFAGIGLRSVGNARGRKRQVARYVAAVVFYTVFTLAFKLGTFHLWSMNSFRVETAPLGWLPYHVFANPIWTSLIITFVFLVYVILIVSSSQKTKSFHLYFLIGIVCVDLLHFSFDRQDLKFRSLGQTMRSIAAEEIMNVDREPYPPRIITYDALTSSYSYYYQRNDLTDALYPNTAALFGISDFQGYEPVKSARYADYLKSVNIGFRNLYPRHFGIVDNVNSPLVRRASVGYIVGDPDYISVVPISGALSTRGTPDEKRYRIPQIGGFASMKIICSTGAGEHLPQDITLILYNKGEEIIRVHHTVKEVFEEEILQFDELGGELDEIGVKQGPNGKVGVFVGFEPRNRGLEVVPIAEKKWVCVSKVSNSLPRVAFYESYVVAESYISAKRYLLMQAQSNVFLPIVEAEKGVMSQGSGGSEEGEVSISEYRNNRISVEVDAKSDGLLVLRDAYYPEWGVRVDGEWSKVYPVDVLFRGVFLKKGTHNVEFVYRAKWFWRGLAISVFSIFVLCCSAGFAVYRKKSGRSVQTG